jgi:hypothetical protein
MSLWHRVWRSHRCASHSGEDLAMRGLLLATARREPGDWRWPRPLPCRHDGAARWPGAECTARQPRLARAPSRQVAARDRAAQNREAQGGHTSRAPALGLASVQLARVWPRPSPTPTRSSSSWKLSSCSAFATHELELAGTVRVASGGRPCAAPRAPARFKSSARSLTRQRRALGGCRVHAVLGRRGRGRAGSVNRGSLVQAATN